MQRLDDDDDDLLDDLSEQPLTPSGPRIYKVDGKHSVLSPLELQDSVPAVSLAYTITRNAFFMLSWFVLATGLSMYNKWLMGKEYYNFPPEVSWATYFKMVVPTGAAGALDIGFSNFSLMFITLSFYTMCKSSAPVFLLFFTIVLRIEPLSYQIIGLIAFISVGLLLTVYGETEFDGKGFTLVMSAAVLAGLRWALTQVLLQKENLGMKHPLMTMNKMMPVMFIILFVVAIPVERLWELSESPHFNSFGSALGTLMLMLCGGFMAFGMIFSEFQFIHDTSAMTFVIAGISKELITILCAVIFFGDEFGPINIAGLVIVIVGIIMFNIYKLYYLKKKVEHPPSMRTQHWQDSEGDSLPKPPGIMLSLDDDDDDENAYL